jgi:hypothetical protein
MQREFPKTFAYLKRFESQLRKRAAFRRYFREDAPFYSIFNIGEYSFSTYKVLWRRVANVMNAAVIGRAGCLGRKKVIAPDATCQMVSFESREAAHYLCALLNSSPARLAIQSYIVLHPDAHVLKNVSMPSFSKDDRLHAKLAELSEAAHKAAVSADMPEVKRIEDQVDRVAAKLWDLSEEELAEIRASLEE